MGELQVVCAIAFSLAAGGVVVVRLWNVAAGWWTRRRELARQRREVLAFHAKFNVATLDQSRAALAEFFAEHPGLELNTGELARGLCRGAMCEYGLRVCAQSAVGLLALSALAEMQAARTATPAE